MCRALRSIPFRGSASGKVPADDQATQNSRSNDHFDEREARHLHITTAQYETEYYKNNQIQYAVCHLVVARNHDHSTVHGAVAFLKNDQECTKNAGLVYGTGIKCFDEHPDCCDECKYLECRIEA
jgi:hypothetical protein